jgi:histidinol-phosphate aminotransferase
VEARRPKAIFITAPNNPDGSLPGRRSHRRAACDLPVLVVIDEAYIEFTSQGGRLGEKFSPGCREVSQRENLVVLRTFSKWAGLAGLRVGYGAFPRWLLPSLWKAKQPYNVNVAASAAAWLPYKISNYLAGNVERIRQERAQLFTRLLAKSPFYNRTLPRPTSSYAR